MLHQTLIPSFPSSASSSLPFFPHANNAAATTTTTPPSLAPRSSSPTMPSYANHHSLNPLDGRTDPMKSCGFLPEETVEEAPAATLVERDGFSVEDLLDLEGKDDAEHEEAPPPAVPAAAEQPEKVNKSPDDSPPMSIVTYKLPPPPPSPEMVDLPVHDVAELEWVSRIVDDSELPAPPQPLAMATAVSHAAAAQRPPLAHRQNHRRPYDGAYRILPPAPGPLRATPTICALSTEAMVPVKARRSKRARSSAWSLSGSPLLSDCTSSSSTTTSSSSSSAASFSPFFPMDAHSAPFGSPDFDGGYHHHFLPPPRQKKSKHGKGGGKNGGKVKKRGRKPKHASHLADASAAALQQAGAQGDRRCSHCGVQKTPQWRAGPEGAKTLCNACGVRYKSGRLLPEYRPACSPTFVSSIHSNSHRKVLEMRRKKEAGLVATAAPAVASF